MIPRIYIDTSVIGGCLDEEFAEESRSLLEMANRGQVVLLVSDLLARELDDAQQPCGRCLPVCRATPWKL